MVGFVGQGVEERSPTGILEDMADVRESDTSPSLETDKFESEEGLIPL